MAVGQPHHRRTDPGRTRRVGGPGGAGRAGRPARLRQRTLVQPHAARASRAPARAGRPDGASRRGPRRGRGHARSARRSRCSRSMQVGMPIANVRWAAEMAIKGPQGGYEEALTPAPGPAAEFLAPAARAGRRRRRHHRLQLPDQLGHLEARPRVWRPGCTLVFKPSPRTPLSTMALMRLVDQVGFPPGRGQLRRSATPTSASC